MNSSTKHKLNNLLGIVRGNLEFLLEDPLLEDKAQSRVEKVMATLQKIDALLEADGSSKSDASVITQSTEDKVLSQDDVKGFAGLNMFVVDDEIITDHAKATGNSWA